MLRINVSSLDGVMSLCSLKAVGNCLGGGDLRARTCFFLFGLFLLRGFFAWSGFERPLASKEWEELASVLSPVTQMAMFVLEHTR